MNQTRRPDDDLHLAQAIANTQKRAGLPFVFGGLLQGGTITLRHGSGNLDEILSKVEIRPSLGLGGLAWQRRSSIETVDYFTYDQISHQYDHAVRSERLTSIVVSPIVVRTHVRGLIYGGLRGEGTIGQAMISRLHQAAAEVARELDIRDEVDRRVTALEIDSAPVTLEGPREDVRELYAELREIARHAEKSELRDDLERALTRFTSPAAGGPELTARQTDVLALVALGCSNAEAAGRLDLSTDTVKNYLQSAMRRLDVDNRHQAVVQARKFGLLP